MNYHSVVELLKERSEATSQSQGDGENISEVDKVNNEQTATS